MFDVPRFLGYPKKIKDKICQTIWAQQQSLVLLSYNLVALTPLLPNNGRIPMGVYFSIPLQSIMCLRSKQAIGELQMTVDPNNDGLSAHSTRCGFQSSSLYSQYFALGSFFLQFYVRSI